MSTEVKIPTFLVNTKALTTVGMDYGELMLEGGINIGLYGTPGRNALTLFGRFCRKGAMGLLF